MRRADGSIEILRDRHAALAAAERDTSGAGRGIYRHFGSHWRCARARSLEATRQREEQEARAAGGHEPRRATAPRHARAGTRSQNPRFGAHAERSSLRAGDAGVQGAPAAAPQSVLLAEYSAGCPGRGAARARRAVRGNRSRLIKLRSSSADISSSAGFGDPPLFRVPGSEHS